MPIPPARTFPRNEIGVHRWEVERSLTVGTTETEIDAAIRTIPLKDGELEEMKFVQIHSPARGRNRILP